MNRRRLATLLAAVVAVGLVIAAFLGGRGGSSGLQVRRNPAHPGRCYTRIRTMGTTGHLEVVADDRAEAEKILTPAVEAVRRVNRLMSTYRPKSDISRLNRNGADGPVELDPQVMTVLEKAIELCRLTDGAFDITSGPIRDVWREAQQKDRPPPESELQEALDRVGCGKLALGDGTARFTADGVEVDLGGIAKGYGIDRAIQEIKANGGEGALVDIGGDMRLLGRRADGDKWKVRVRTPPRIELEKEVYLRVTDKAIATSGDYAQYFRVGGRRYSHIVDPRTGRPVTKVPSCTVLARTATMADGLATAISVLGPEKGLQVVEKVDGAECLIMVQEDDGVRLVESDGFSDYRYYPGEEDEAE